MSAWALAWRNILRNRRRSLLTAGIVVFGFAAFALAGGFMRQTFEGLRRATIRGGTGDLQFARPQTFSGTEKTTLEFGITDAEKVARILGSNPAVEAVLPQIDFVGLVSNGSSSVPYLGLGLDPAPEARVMEAKELIVQGRWLADAGERGVVLGTGLARTLGVHAGATVTIFGTTPDGVLNALDVTVVGLADIPIKELNERYLATTLGAASRLLNVSGVVSRMVVTLKPGADPPRVKGELSAALKAAGAPLAVRTWQELATFYRQVKLLYIGIFGFMGAVLVIVVLLACANTMTMAVTERTREIGTLRAIGTPSRHIRAMFVAEGMLMGGIGCAIGAVLALLICAALNASHIMLPPPPGATHGAPIHVAFYAATYLAGFVAMTATLALASYFPARRASRVAITEALAHV